MSAQTKDARKQDSAPGKIHNAEEYANYVHAVSIPMKVVMAAIVVFFAGIIVFCVFGNVPVSINVVAVVDGSGTCDCYVKADDFSEIDVGDPVQINGSMYSVSSICNDAECVDDTFSDYVRNTGELSIGEYVFVVTVNTDLSQGVYSATLIKDYLRPLSVLLTS